MKHWLKPSSPSGLILIVVLMFGFGFALVPLYDVFCEVTGLNGKTKGAYQGDTNALAANSDRTITVQFVANRNDNLPWGFYPEQEEIKLTVGERKQIHFSVNNSYNRSVVAQAIPSVSPPQAADYLNKIECFCFQRQPLAAGEAKQFPLVFFVDPALPEEISKLTLSYTLFDISERDASGVD